MAGKDDPRRHNEMLAQIVADLTKENAALKASFEQRLAREVAEQVTRHKLELDEQYRASREKMLRKDEELRQREEQLRQREAAIGSNNNNGSGVGGGEMAIGGGVSASAIGRGEAATISKGSALTSPIEYGRYEFPSEGEESGSSDEFDWERYAAEDPKALAFVGKGGAVAASCSTNSKGNGRCLSTYGECRSLSTSASSRELPAARRATRVARRPCIRCGSLVPCEHTKCFVCDKLRRHFAVDCPKGYCFNCDCYGHQQASDLCPKKGK